MGPEHKREEFVIMKKKLAAMILCGLVLSAAGCSQNSKPPEETKAQTEQNTDAAQAEGETTMPEYSALDYVTLGEYKGLEITLIETTPTEEEVLARIESDLSQKNKLEEVTEGTVGDTDIVNIDYVGMVDGEDLEGGTDKNVNLTLGGSNVISGFEEGDFGTTIANAMAQQLKGAQIGSDVEVSATFPETYETDKELAGKTAVFTVTVNSVKKVPELTDEIAAEISESKTAEEYRESVRSTLEEEKKAQQDAQKVNDLFAEIYSTSTIKDYPQDVVDYNLNTLIGYYEAYAKDAGQTMEEFLQQNFNTTEDQFREDSLQMVKDSLSQEMILKAIAETEDLTISEAEYQEGLEQYAKDSGMDGTEEYLKTTSKEKVLLNLLLDKALAVVEDSAQIRTSGETEAVTE